MQGDRRRRVVSSSADNPKTFSVALEMAEKG